MTRSRAQSRDRDQLRRIERDACIGVLLQRAGTEIVKPALRAVRHATQTRPPTLGVSTRKKRFNSDFLLEECCGLVVWVAGFHLFVLLQEATLQTKPLDATVGRFIVQFISDPVAVLRSLSQLVRRGGVLAFQDVSYVPFRLFSAHRPLWSAGVSINRIFQY